METSEPPLLAAVYYLRLHGYATVVPLSAIRYTVQIAKNEKTDQKNTTQLIKEISHWFKNYSSKSQKELEISIILYIRIPYRIMTILNKMGFKKYVERKISQWMAFDLYPEYAENVNEIVDFIREILDSDLDMFDEES